MEKIMTLNSGQYVLLGFVVTSLQGKHNCILSLTQTMKVAELVEELTEPELYEYETSDCPDFGIMIKPEQAYQIFDVWYEENETYFEEVLVDSNL